MKRIVSVSKLPDHIAKERDRLIEKLNPPSVYYCEQTFNAAWALAEKEGNNNDVAVATIVHHSTIVDAKHGEINTSKALHNIVNEAIELRRENELITGSLERLMPRLEHHYPEGAIRPCYDTCIKCEIGRIMISSTADENRGEE